MSERSRMKLHEAIAQVLREHNNRPLTAREIADAIASRRLYLRRVDRLTPPPGQVSARIGNRKYSPFYLIDKSVRPQRYCLSHAGLNRFGKNEKQISG